MTILEYIGFPQQLGFYAEVFDFLLVSNISLFLIVLIVFMGAGKLIFPLVIAKFRGRPILLLGRKDRKIDVVPMKMEGGMFRSKQYGDFMVIPESIYSLKNGVSCAIAYEPYGSTLTNELLDSTSTLKEFGFQTFQDLETTDKPTEALEDLEKMKNDSEKNLEKHMKIYNSLIKKKTLTSEQKKQMKESIMIIEQHREKLFNLSRITRSVDNVRNFFKYNINPHSMRATINRVVADVVQEYTKTDWGKWIIWILILIIGGALAYFIISSAMTSGGGGVANTLNTAVESTKVVSGATIT